MFTLQYHLLQFVNRVRSLKYYSFSKGNRLKYFNYFQLLLELWDWYLNCFDDLLID